MTRPPGAPVRLGLVGCGAIACYAHLRALRRMPGAVLVAAADPDPEARARARRLAKAAFHERADDLLAREDVEAVVISAPTHLHAELATAAAAAGKHVYLEKPLATGLEEARRVLEAVERSGVTAAIGFNRRVHPVFEEGRRLLREGRVGDVRAVHTAFCEPTPPDRMPAWKRRRATGGGVLLDLASHHVDLVRWLLEDEVAEVRSTLASDLTEHDSAWLRIRMRGGAEVASFFSFRASFADFVELIGERGTLRIDRHRPAPDLRVARRVGYGPRRGWFAPASSAVAWRLRRALPFATEPSYRLALQAFVDLLRGGPRRVPSLEDGLRSLEVVLAAEASAGAAGPVHVPVGGP